jgi:hypothetical protein
MPLSTSKTIIYKCDLSSISLTSQRIVLICMNLICQIEFIIPALVWRECNMSFGVGRGRIKTRLVCKETGKWRVPNKN